jgi:hypothetical protein
MQVICSIKKGKHDNLWLVASDNVGRVVVVIPGVRLDAEFRLELLDDAGDGIKLATYVLNQKQDVYISHVDPTPHLTRM